jgi:hydrophobe/amphiphile efflux-1 (HAE1) family protein
MKLTHFFIDHPRFATVLSLFIAVFGLATMFTLPVAQYPNIVPPTIEISTVFPGASAETVAKTVATPLEQAINGVENMDYISSQSTGDGRLTITVIFKIGSDPNTDLMLTRNRVQDTLSRLPQEVQLQGVTVKKTIKALVLGVHVYSPDGSRSPAYMSNYMLKIRDEIARIPGVSEFQLFGDRPYAMRIWIDPDKAVAYNISASEILAALRAQNVQVSAGVLNQPPVVTDSAYQINVEALGRLTTTEEFGNIIVKSDNQGRVTRIKDVGRVELGSSDYGTIAYADEFSAAPWFVVATPGANVVQVENAVWDKMAELRKNFPSGMDYKRIYDPTTFVSQSIHEVIETIFIAILLVVGVVYLFLQNFRSTIIPVIAIPISLIGAFSILAMLGISVNNLSLFGLVLAVGIVVDDAIVVVENVERNMAFGIGPKEAAHKTMDEVARALIAIALTLCAVFVPTAFISGISGLFFTQFAVTIAASTVISCFVSLTLSPALCAILLKPRAEQKPNLFKRWTSGFFDRFNCGFTWLSSSYGQMTARFVRITGVLLLIYGVLIGLTGVQMSRMPTGFIPEQDIGYLAIVVQLPPGSSLDRTDKVVQEVNKLAHDVIPGNLMHTSPVTGLDVVTNTIQPNVGVVFISLPSLYGLNVPGVNARTMVAALQKKLAVVKDAFVLVVNPPPVQGLGAPGGIKLMVQDRGGLGPQALEKAAKDLVAAANTDPNRTFAAAFTVFNTGSPSVFADIDRTKAEKVGLTPSDVFSTMALYLGSQYVNDFNYMGRTYPVYVQGDQQFRKTIDDIGRLKVRNATGEMVPVGSVASFKQTTAPYRVPRYNLFPAAEVQAIAKPSVASGAAMDRLEQIAAKTLPPGISFEWTDLAHQQAQKGIPTTAIFAAAAFFVFLVLAAQYESWTIPLSIVLILPMCLLASSTGLSMRDMPIDILAEIGFVVLVGLAAKNAILIVEFAKHHEDNEGASPEDAASHSAQERLRPILMTSLAFIAGVFPLAIASGAGSEMRQSLGTTVFAGMLGVTIFGLLFTPALYTFVRNLGKKTEPLT